jgi:DNA-binding GntR family transcriptional regulator
MSKAQRKQLDEITAKIKDARARGDWDEYFRQTADWRFVFGQTLR